MICAQKCLRFSFKLNSLTLSHFELLFGHIWVEVLDSDNFKSFSPIGSYLQFGVKKGNILVSLARVEASAP